MDDIVSDAEVEKAVELLRKTGKYIVVPVNAPSTPPLPPRPPPTSTTPNDKATEAPTAPPAVSRWAVPKWAALRKICDRFPPTPFLPESLFPYGTDMIPVGSTPDPSVWKQEWDQQQPGPVHLVNYGFALDEAWAIKFAAQCQTRFHMEQRMTPQLFKRSSCPRIIDFATLTPDVLASMKKDRDYWKYVWAGLKNLILAHASEKFEPMYITLGHPISRDNLIVLVLFDNYNATKRVWLTGCLTHEPIMDTVNKVKEWLTLPGLEPPEAMWWYESTSPLIPTLEEELDD
ncbi:uncharacterized protein BXZ73DRAFT_76788 [Epithele typhae]|uniref:uncharacterized protein n=1 Tax=Epithele typhae TaxID=378194 RepID=UPI00200767F0|nr:uncharacterized protein BXZ73DRAFT_76788 [Epithele typhae]KAH9935984.1 hypothetical protein BXZ73DRAFT_76788 [Epithele typhae]